ncbi:MAG: flagellar biosynthetic protein FliQ [Burkholderiaceae bacterium]
MDAAAVIDLARESLMIIMLVSLPLLGVALVVGLAIGVFQAATSINEMTLTYDPK